MKNLSSLACAIMLLAAAILGCASANTNTSEINRSTPKSFVSTANAAPSHAAKSDASNQTTIASADSSSSSAEAGAARLKSGELPRTPLPDSTTGGVQNVKSNQSGKGYWSPGGSSRVAKSSAPGKIVSPAIENSGATAKCWDGSLSFSAHRRGTCSHHGGVAIWY